MQRACVSPSHGCRIVRLYWSGPENAQPLTNSLLFPCGGGWGWRSGSTLLSDLRGTVMAYYKILRAPWFGICCLLLTVCSSPSTSPSLRFFAFKVGPPLRHFLCLLGLSTAAACLPNTRIVSHASEAGSSYRRGSQQPALSVRKRGHSSRFRPQPIWQLSFLVFRLGSRLSPPFIEDGGFSW